MEQREGDGGEGSGGGLIFEGVIWCECDLVFGSEFIAYVVV